MSQSCQTVGQSNRPRFVLCVCVGVGVGVGGWVDAYLHMYMPTCMLCPEGINYRCCGKKACMCMYCNIREYLYKLVQHFLEGSAVCILKGTGQLTYCVCVLV